MDFWWNFGNWEFAADAVFPGILSTFRQAAEAAAAEFAAHSLIKKDHSLIKNEGF